MNQEICNRSLLPYLNPSTTGVYLNISLVTEDPASFEELPFPFRVLNDSDPLTRIIGARFLTDAGLEIKKVFLLLQKDKYNLGKNCLQSFDNKQLETCWQKAFSFYKRRGREGFAIVLGDQLDNNGEFVPLASLFFCKAKQVFFVPPCPYCGRPLEQCYNDELLEQSGLPAYSTSLSRYLFCPSCCASRREPHFYTYDLEGLETALVKDWRGLVKDFAWLIEKGTSTENFPCGQCSNSEVCYGRRVFATSEIVPFSFYPFFMLIFDEMPLKASEFLPLISGASLEDLKAWIHEKGELSRLKSAQSAADTLSHKTVFFFEGGRKHFLEILYLKLTFLAQLVKLTFADPESPPHPDLRPTLDNIWVKFGDQASLIPQFWNFNVTVIDVASSLPEAALPPAIPLANALHFVGLAWFYTLLANKQQDTSAIYRSLKRALEVTSQEEPLFSAHGCEDTFGAQNLFWDPEGKTIDESWRLFWEEALLLGDSLLRTSLIANSSWSKKSFWQRLVALRDAIKDQLFMDQTQAQRLERPPEDEVLHIILKDLMERWEKELCAVDEALKETGVFSPKRSGDEREVPDMKDDAALEETVVLSGKRVSDQRGGAPGGPEQVDLKETLVFSPASKKEKAAIPLHERDEEALPETVILSPRKEPSQRGRESIQGFPPEKKAAPQERATSRPEPTQEEIGRTRRKKEDDFLTETVFISPEERGKLDKDKKK